MPELNDPGVVAREYEDESRLVARRRAWSEFREGPSSDEAALDAVRRAAPRRVLEIGCGWGELAERIAETGAEVTAIDQSFRMAQLALEAGVRALVADGQALPFGANRFDLVIANAVMYHIPNLDLALTEVGRVLVADGVFVATTLNSDDSPNSGISLGTRRRHFRSTRTPPEQTFVGISRR